MSSTKNIVNEVSHELPNDLWLFEKFLKLVETGSSASLPSRNKTSVTAVKKLRKRIYQSFVFLYNFAWFLYFVSYILSAIVGFTLVSPSIFGKVQSVIANI